jgi:hypothetical protein
VLGKSAAPAPRVDEQDEAVFDTPVGGFNDADITGLRESAVAASPVEDEDDTLSYFAKLAEED